jgi:8-oxo-dGTP pyrophosphatase MutT (NUDIX family)
VPHQKQAVGLIITTTARDGAWFSVRKPSKSGFFDGYDQVPGGKVDPGEDPLDAMKRELKEETGLEVAWPDCDGRDGHFSWLTRGEYQLPDGTPYVSIHYLWETDEVPQHCEPDNNEAWRYVKISDFASLRLMESTRDAITEALTKGDLR